MFIRKMAVLYPPGCNYFFIFFFTLRGFDFEYPQGVHFRIPSGWCDIYFKRYLSLRRNFDNFVRKEYKPGKLTYGSCSRISSET
jgi:hypothetical protein